MHPASADSGWPSTLSSPVDNISQFPPDFQEVLSEFLFDNNGYMDTQYEEFDVETFLSLGSELPNLNPHLRSNSTITLMSLPLRQTLSVSTIRELSQPRRVLFTVSSKVISQTPGKRPYESAMFPPPNLEIPTFSQPLCPPSTPDPSTPELENPHLPPLKQSLQMTNYFCLYCGVSFMTENSKKCAYSFFKLNILANALFYLLKS